MPEFFSAAMPGPAWGWGQAPESRPAGPKPRSEHAPGVRHDVQHGSRLTRGRRRETRLPPVESENLRMRLTQRARGDAAESGLPRQDAPTMGGGDGIAPFWRAPERARESEGRARQASIRRGVIDASPRPRLTVGLAGPAGAGVVRGLEGTDLQGPSPRRHSGSQLQIEPIAEDAAAGAASRREHESGPRNRRSGEPVPGLCPGRASSTRRTWSGRTRPREPRSGVIVASSSSDSFFVCGGRRCPRAAIATRATLRRESVGGRRTGRRLRGPHDGTLGDRPRPRDASMAPTGKCPPREQTLAPTNDGPPASRWSSVRSVEPLGRPPSGKRRERSARGQQDQFSISSPRSARRPRGQSGRSSGSSARTVRGARRSTPHRRTPRSRLPPGTRGRTVHPDPFFTGSAEFSRSPFES